MNWFDNAPRRVMAVVCLACVALLAFGMYLQHVVGLEPCPMCIVQRYALVLIAVCAGLTAASTRKSLQISGSVLLVLLACAGAFVAARQSWLQWYPPEVVSCGRDLYGMIETFPLKRALPMIFVQPPPSTLIVKAMVAMLNTYASRAWRNTGRAITGTTWCSNTLARPVPSSGRIRTCGCARASAASDAA